jgi:hypothetical protein
MRPSTGPCPHSRRDGRSGVAQVEVAAAGVVPVADDEHGVVLVVVEVVEQVTDLGGGVEAAGRRRQAARARRSAPKVVE